MNNFPIPPIVPAEPPKESTIYPLTDSNPKRATHQIFLDTLHGDESVPLRVQIENPVSVLKDDHQLVDELSLLTQSHPNLVHFLGRTNYVDNGNTDSEVHESLNNAKSLYDLFEEGLLDQISFSDKFKIALAILDGLDHMHGEDNDRGIILRDIKPENLLVVTDGSNGDLNVADARLGDFNLVSREGMPKGEKIQGTLEYFTPEELLAKDPDLELDRRSDIYKAGLLIFELLTNLDVQDITYLNIPLIEVNSMAARAKSNFEKQMARGRRKEMLNKTGEIKNKLTQELDSEFKVAKKRPGLLEKEEPINKQYSDLYANSDLWLAPDSWPYSLTEDALARAFQAGVPDELLSVLVEATMKNPEDRFQTAREFKMALAHAMQKALRKPEFTDRIGQTEVKNLRRAIEKSADFETNFAINS